MGNKQSVSILSEEQYNNLKENEHGMAQACGGYEHLYTLVRAKLRKSEKLHLKGCQAPYSDLPRQTTLSNLARYLSSRDAKPPAADTIQKITTFFYNNFPATKSLPYDENILLNQKIDFQTTYKFVEHPVSKENWISGNYYCYYYDLSSKKIRRMNGAILKILKHAIKEQGQANYQAFIITGFSSEKSLKDAAVNIMEKDLRVFDSYYEQFKAYLAEKSDSEKKIIYWSGFIEETSNKLFGDFTRPSTGEPSIDLQELLLFLFKYPGSHYDNCKGCCGMSIKINSDQQYISNSKVFISSALLPWNDIQLFIDQIVDNNFVSRTDDDQFLEEILHYKD